jgi:hypothetical protein
MWNIGLAGFSTLKKGADVWTYVALYAFISFAPKELYFDVNRI